MFARLLKPIALVTERVEGATKSVGSTTRLLAKLSGMRLSFSCFISLRMERWRFQQKLRRQQQKCLRAARDRCLTQSTLASTKQAG